MQEHGLALTRHTHARVFFLCERRSGVLTGCCSVSNCCELIAGCRVVGVLLLLRRRCFSVLNESGSLQSKHWLSPLQEACQVLQPAVGWNSLGKKTMPSTRAALSLAAIVCAGASPASADVLSGCVVVSPLRFLRKRNSPSRAAARVQRVLPMLGRSAASTFVIFLSAQCVHSARTDPSTSPAASTPQSQAGTATRPLATQPSSPAGIRTQLRVRASAALPCATCTAD